MLQVGHVAVNRPIRHFQPLGQVSGRGKPPAADQLDDVEQAVGTAHGRNVTVPAIY
jgi:hypothetical protein